MFIDPIQAVNQIEEISKINGVGSNQGIKQKNDFPGYENGVEGAEGQQGAQVPFKSFFEDAIKDVIETDQQVNINAEMLATGQSDNLHQYSLDIAKAQLSLDLLVELRNKALDAYSEVMRMSI